MALKSRKTRKEPSLTSTISALMAQGATATAPKWSPADTLMAISLMRRVVEISDHPEDREAANAVLDHICGGRLTKADKIFASLAYEVIR